MKTTKNFFPFIALGAVLVIFTCSCKPTKQMGATGLPNSQGIVPVSYEFLKSNKVTQSQLGSWPIFVSAPLYISFLDFGGAGTVPTGGLADSVNSNKEVVDKQVEYSIVCMDKNFNWFKVGVDKNNLSKFIYFYRKGDSYYPFVGYPVFDDGMFHIAYNGKKSAVEPSNAQTVQLEYIPGVIHTSKVTKAAGYPHNNNGNGSAGGSDNGASGSNGQTPIQ